VQVHRRLAVVLLAGGCRQLFGLEDPTAAPDPADAPASPSVDAPADAQKLCPADYVQVGSSHYRFVETRARWLDAVSLCADDQPDGPPFTHLVVINSEAERQALLALRAPTNDAYWIGLSDLAVSGQWQWVTAEDTGGYPATPGPEWSQGQPMSGADCTVIVGPMYGPGTNGLYYADYCKPPASVNLEYICECDGYADDPARH
jgi:hypothetical protein